MNNNNNTINKFPLSNQGSLSVSNVYLPGSSGDVHNTPLLGYGNVLTGNNMRLATKIVGNFFSTDVSLVSQGSSRASQLPQVGGGKDRKTSASSLVLTNPVGGVKALASKPVFNMSGEKVVITTFYYVPVKEQSLSNSSINSLGDVLSKVFKRPVELRLVRLHYPYLNAYILAQYIAINSRKYNFTRIQRAIFNAVKSVKVDANTGENGSLLPAYITGIKIKISGRLTTQKSVPRQTEQTAQIGTFSSSSIVHGKGIIESASFTSKNKKGAFTVKVWISQVAYTD